MNKNVIGKTGEELSVAYLKSMGHRILECGYRCKFGEIDIISFKDKTLHFIEVKTRSSNKYGAPRDAVTKEKLKHIRNVAEVYLKRIGVGVNTCLPDFDCSIDVIEVMVNHIEGVE